MPLSASAQASLSADQTGLAPLDPFPPGKSLHFLGGLALGLAAAGITDAVCSPAYLQKYPVVLPLVALSAATVGGIAKEILDSTGFGDPRFTDIIITMTGGLAAVCAALYAQAVYPATLTGRADSSSFLISMSVSVSFPVIVGFIGEIRRAMERSARLASAVAVPPAGMYEDPDGLAALIAGKSRPYYLVDVRSADEYASGHIPSAVNIPVADIRTRPPTKDKDALIIVYCLSGRRSRQAKAALDEMGYRLVVDFGALGRWNGDLVPGDQPEAGAAASGAAPALP